MEEQKKRNKQIYSLRQKGWTFQRLADKYELAYSRIMVICKHYENKYKKITIKSIKEQEEGK